MILKNKFVGRVKARYEDSFPTVQVKATQFSNGDWLVVAEGREDTVLKDHIFQACYGDAELPYLEWPHEWSGDAA